MNPAFDLIVVGGGIVGAATAYNYRQQNPSARIAILEKEARPAAHQTGRNSGVIHSGLYYKPGSLKARTCLSGYAQLLDFCAENDVAHEVCGKIVVATDSQEAARLRGLAERGTQNGLQGLRFLDAAQAREIEPHIEAYEALWVPQTGIVDYVGMTQKLLERATEGQGSVRLNCRVHGLERKGAVSVVKTTAGTFEAPHVVVCAGLQSDRIAAQDGVQNGIRIVPFRGDYYDLTPEAAHKVRNLVYPVPDPEFPFLGVHFTRMVEGGVECGPNAVFSFAREGYSKTAFDAKDSASALGFGGTWRLFAQHWRYGLGEYERAFSKTKFLKALQKMMPGLQMKDIVPGRAGIRAQTLDQQGKLVDDFVLENGAAATHVINAPSPAATASLAIAQEILTRLD
jgi:L-2-hydroxyglutarate oxidase